ncbi:hypothetical protein [Thermobifida cellulosilytica]|uniref:GH18 domain-containing protein n=1 Tax=Thermobifida cellulosilytica TB100 TaxID=665004 RepID=A0A147KD22_THECS|nr:hypothetical protein [Thermobifida cellulosilytica]KUP95193.1 hypothetical protein AC529_18605 [Thermobifida cellulosilytica TB100]
MRWLLTRLLAGLAAVLVVAVGAGVLLAAQFSGEKAEWAVSTGADAAWLDASWLDGEADLAAALPRLRSFSEVYVHVGEIAEDGSVDPDGYAQAGAFLERMGRELPEVRVLGWLSSTADGSSLLEDRVPKEARARLVEAAAAVVDAGFDGVHYDITPVTVNDPGFVALLEETREAVGEEAVLSVLALPVEPLPGVRLPVFLAERGERYWSTGFLQRVAEPADVVVVSGGGTGMPGGSLYGGFMARQTELALRAVPEETGLRIGTPRDAAPDDLATAAEAVRIALTGHGERDGFGMAVHAPEAMAEEEWAAFEEGWLAPSR